MLEDAGVGEEQEQQKMAVSTMHTQGMRLAQLRARRVE